MRRGQAELIGHVIRIMVLALLVFLLSIQIGFFTGMQPKKNSLEAELVTQRILFGPNGLALTEEKTGRVLVGTIDVTKLTDSRLAAIYSEGFGDDNLWGGRITLYSDARLETVVRPTAHLNKGVADSLLPLAKSRVKGKGSGDYYGFLYTVRYSESPDQPRKTGWLTIELVKRT